jgi:ribosomal protein S18 acetylase RimI-like enzyme
MAAVSEAHIPEVVDLWQVRSHDLNPVLDEETEDWRELLHWDFRASADLVRRFVGVRALNGYALVISGEPVGYTYFVAEEHKALIGDLFVRSDYRTPQNEHRLLAAVIEHLTRARYVRRIESQLMLVRSLERRLLPGAQYARPYERNFMLMPLDSVSRLPQKSGLPVVFDPWVERRQEETAQLIAAAYRGHIDSEINDQYRSPAGARRFLFNIVQYPGCGAFFYPASWAAFRADTGGICGVSLTSMVAGDVGHITQICVLPSMKGKGVGYELLRRSMLSLAEAGATRVSLTVTAANGEAVGLYERIGYRTVRRFPALVWEGF